MAKSLLIVDDSATMRKIVMKTVRMSGLEFDQIEEAGNGAEAIDKLKNGAVDLVLCDINMPEMSGIEMVKKVRSDVPECSNTKIVMVSTESSQTLIDELLAEGADGYITKPFTPEKFQEKLTTLAEKNELPSDFQVYYRTWLKILEGHYMNLFQSPEYLQALAKTLSASAAYTKAKKDLMNDLLEQLSMPSSENINGVYKELYDLKKRIKHLEKSISIS